MKAFGVSFFLSCGLYGSRPVSHRDAYMRSPGWLSLELGSWTLEVDWPTKPIKDQPTTEAQAYESSLLP
jgi:hypothetical protein